MTKMEAIRERHSVRQYRDQPLRPEEIAQLTEEVKHCNQESGLHIQLVTNEPKAFDSWMARYGKFSGVSSYFALIGTNSAHLQETCGYYGERLVLKAQQMGLNTCWAAQTFRKVKTAYTLDRGEKLCAVIALGYGAVQGKPHRSKSMAQVAKTDGEMPEWFRAGVEAALLAPTAMNQQKFMFTLADGRVSVQAGKGFYTKVDLGIVKYHFELGAGTQSVPWAE